MNDPLELQSVTDFVLEDKKHLEIAVRIAQAFPTVQRRIVASMLDELEKKLSVALGANWEVYNCKDEVFVSRYAGFSVWGKSWGDHLCLNMENQTREKRTVVGIWREKKPRNTTLDDALETAFAKMGVSGKQTRWWAWYKALPAEYGNWNDTSALAALHFQKSEVVNVLASELLTIHRVAAPIMAAHVSSE